LIGKLLALALVLVLGFLLTTRAIPWIARGLLRLLGFRAKASPVTLKRIARFKRIRRGYWSFLAITTLFVTSLFLELLVSGRALVVRYDGHTAFPAVSQWVGKVLFFADISYFQKKSDFGQVGDSEVDYRKFAADCADPGKLRKEIDDERSQLAAERAELEARGKPTSKRERNLAETKEKAFKRREAELDLLDKAHAVFAAGRASCLMPIYEYGPEEFRHEIKGNPPNSPSLEQGIPLGTDMSGRDVLVLLLYGFRISLAFALIIWVVGYAIGIAVGALQGYYGGWIDIGLQRFEEIWSAIPFLYTIMIIASLMTPTFAVLLLLMIFLVSWLTITSYMRAEFYREKAKDYVQAAIGTGVSDWRIMTRHILPNALVPVVTFSPFTIVGYVFSLVSLDFLGFGLPPGTPSWGNLLNQGLENVLFNPHLVTAPVTALIVTLLSLVLVGEAVREAFDPKVFSRLR
jgi:microcin C transport system permease protein